MKKNDLINFGSFVAIGVAFFLSQPASAKLSLKDYLSQVQHNNLGYRAAQEQSSGASLKSEEAELYFSPRLFAEAREGHDGKEVLTSSITSTRLNMQNYSLGVGQEFSLGLQAKFSYAFDKTEIEGAKLPASIPASYWKTTPTLELSLPLLGNAWGRQSVAQQEVARQQSLADHWTAEFQGTGLMVEAEATYWRLACAQEIVNIQKQALKQAQAILDYVHRKTKMNLGENADVLQAKALVEARVFQLQQAQNQEKAALRAFNTFINQNADVRIEALDDIPLAQMAEFKLPNQQPGDRYDVKAALAQTTLAQAANQIIIERNKPKFDLYSSYSLEGTSADFNTALDKVTSSSRDSVFVGARLSMPLNWSSLQKTQAGATKARLAAELSLQQKQFIQQQDWLQLNQQLDESKESLRLAGNIVHAQKLKLENERERLHTGRTTTYQVLLFEQDYSQSQVAQVQAAAQVLSLYSQAKLYQTSSEGVR